MTELNIGRRKDTDFKNEFFDYTFHPDPKGHNKLLFILPGMGSNTRSQDSAVFIRRRLCFGIRAKTIRGGQPIRIRRRTDSDDALYQRS